MLRVATLSHHVPIALYKTARTSCVYQNIIAMATNASSADEDLTTFPTTSEEVVAPALNRTRKSGWFDWLPSWTPTSEDYLIQSEANILKNLQTPYTDHYVPIGDDSFIRTISLSPIEETTPTDMPSYPLVMVHGFGCGLGAFYKNYDYLHTKRQLYAFDVLGFGRSSRTQFSSDPEEIESQFVESFEKWRQQMGLEKFILLGHSLGAFMSTLYAMKYPERVRHLILVDTWGFVEKPDESEVRSGRSRLIVSLANYYVRVFSPFTIIRALGPYGPRVFSRFRGDLQEKFGDHFIDYIYHSNMQTPATGENAFACMQLPIAYAKQPLLNRLDSLSSSLPMSMLYGTRSWFDNSTGEKVYSMRPNSFVDIHYVKGAGHHIHAEMPDIFNQIINNICDMVDSNKDSLPVGETRNEEDAFHTH